MRGAGEADREAAGRRPESHSHRAPPPASDSEDDSVSEAEMDEEAAARGDSAEFLIPHSDLERAVDPEMQARLEALLEAAGIGKISGEGKHLTDPEVLRRLTSSVSCALDEAAAALTRMRSDQPAPSHRHHQDKPTACGSTATGTVGSTATTTTEAAPSLAEACSDGDVGTVRKLLTEGRSVHETTEEGESLLSLACSAGYYELAQVLLAMHASVEDRGIKGDCTPLMEAASAGHVEIVGLLIAHGADVNAQSGSGNTPLMYACAGGHEAVVQALLKAGANVEDHNENGHTPLMEAASAGHVGVAKILLENGAGINTHSNEFKESALTLACYKGHLDMVRFLLAAGADREHKTDEMHTALMEASMDGHVEVARLLLDSGAQVNMPTDSFESPLTLAACGGHVDLAMLLLERGANIEEVNDEGYTPLMEAAREGHEEMVALLLGQGAAINAQTEETQETALTLACCGGFLDVAEFLIKAGADVELGASTPLMEAAQEGHLELVKHLLTEGGAYVQAQTQTGDTALTYACENGHTDVAATLLRYGANLEHESEGGRTPLMKACRAGHLCTVQFLVGKGADVNRATANGDHTPLSLACAGGHVEVVKFLLACEADPFRKLKDNSTTLIEAAKGGHTAVVQLLLDYPHSVMMARGAEENAQATTGLTPQQAAQLGLGHVPGPGAPHQRAIVPVAPPVAPPSDIHTAVTPPPTDLPFAKACCEGARKKMSAAGMAVTAPAPVAPPVGFPKHKCGARKVPRAGLQPADYHLPPPPDIDEQYPPELTAATQPIQEAEVQEVATGPPTLATSALHALDLQPFCAQGVTTTPIFPNQASVRPQNTVTQSTAIEDRPKAKPVSKKDGKGRKAVVLEALQQFGQNLTEHQLAELQQQQQQLQQLRQQQQQQQQQQQKLQQTQQQPVPAKQQNRKTGVRELWQEEQVYQEGILHGINAAAQCLEARELGAVLAYLQREVPSLVALPPAELRALVLQVMHQKSHEILQQKRDSGECEEYSAGEERQARRLLAAAAQEALSGEWQARHTDCESHQDVLSGSKSRPDPIVISRLPPGLPIEAGNSSYRLRPPSPTSGDLAPWRLSPTEGSEDEPAPPAPFHTLQPIHEDAATFVAPQPAQQAPATSTVGVQATQAAPAHGKRDACTAPNHTSTPPPLKKKGRFPAQRHTHKAEPAPGYPHPPHPAPAPHSAMDVDGETDSNHDTALTLACAGGHEELVELLLSRGADIEHRDKKGFTPLILAATAGHEKIVEILLNHGADIEAQSERTKDTPLSLACSGGRYEVVELVLARGANKEHRNVSDYTPLSLAASGGYVNIIRLLLHHQAEINSRTGSKLGISPLMLAAMNGHVAAVRLLLDCGSDINAQIETNRNTALTLACFQGRHEVVSLLLDRKANVEHRAKTGLTPLMEAASGGYVDVGRVLLDKGADVNAPPVPSSRDTALTIAADKGHARFVELLLQRRAAVEVKNKKGNSPLWLAANGGHLSVVEMLYAAGADIDSQDNRKVSCLMAAFRKGHTKVVKWMVGVVTQFPSDQEMTRYIYTISDKELLEKCQECVRVIRAAKETQAQRANENADILLEELKTERCREQSRRQAAARRRERKKKKKMEKKVEEEQRRKLLEGEAYVEKPDDDDDDDEASDVPEEEPPREEGDSGIDANSQGSCSSSDVKPPPAPSTKSKKKKTKEPSPPTPTSDTAPLPNKQPDKVKLKLESKPGPAPSKLERKQEKENVAPSEPANHSVVRKDLPTAPANEKRALEKKDKRCEEDKGPNPQTVPKHGVTPRKGLVFESTRYTLEEHERRNRFYENLQWETETKTSPKGAGVSVTRREDGWKEVVRKSSVQTVSTVEPGCKKVVVAAHAISRVIGRAGSNINAIRSATGAHIEVDKQGKGQGERVITIKGSAEATKQAATLIAAMIRDPDADITHLLPRAKLPAPAPAQAQAKPTKQPTNATKTVAATPTPAAAARVAPGMRAMPAKQPATLRAQPPRMQLPSMSDKRTSAPTPLAAAACAKQNVTYSGLVGARPQHSFAATLSQDNKPRHAVSVQASASVPNMAAVAPKPITSEAPTPLRHEELPHPQASPEMQWGQDDAPSAQTAALHINTAQTSGASEYTLFQDLAGGRWLPAPTSDPHHHNPDPPPVQVDASKAPGYRGGGGAGGGCSPSSHSSTPPPLHAHQSLDHTPTGMKSQQMAIQRPSAVATSVSAVLSPIGVGVATQPMGNGVSPMDIAGLARNGPIYQDNSRNGHNMMMSPAVGVSGLGYVGVDGVSRLNPRAPDFSHQPPTIMHHNHNQLFAGAGSAGLGTLLMSYQQQQSSAKPQQPPMQHPYQSLLECGVGPVGGMVSGAGAGWGAEEEERKPKPIGTERAWKLSAPDDWSRDRYQGMESGSGGATAAALSLMHSIHYNMPPHEPRPHWDPHADTDKQGWSSKWTH